MPILLCALALVLAGCGGGGNAQRTTTTSQPVGTPDPAAKAAAQRYLDAYARKDAAAICASLGRRVQRQLADAKGTCVRTIRSSLKGERFERLVVARALADGATAHALVKGSKRQVTLERESGAWKVVDGGA